MQEYDIVIAGAGPAGLSIASELSKNSKILIFDCRIPLTTGATWYSYEDRMKKYGLEKAIANRCVSLIYKSPHHSHEMIDDCVVVDEEAVFAIWKEKLLSNGGELRKLRLLSYEYKDNGVIINTDKEAISAKLLIDCTGINSPILSKHQLVEHINSWVCYGYRLTTDNVDTQHIYYLPLNDDINTYVGIHPVSKDEVNFYVFINVENEVGNSALLKNSFEEARKKYFPNSVKGRCIEGKIISGELKQYALDKVVFFGEAGMFTPPGCGMGFNEILKQHGNFSRGITKLMNANEFNAKKLIALSNSLKDQETINFQRIIAKFSYHYNFDASKYDGGVQWLNKMGTESKYWMRNEINLKWIAKGIMNLKGIFSLKDVLHVMPYEDFVFVARNFSRFIGATLKKYSGAAD